MSAQDHASPVPAKPHRPLLRSLWLVACVLLALLQVKWAGYELGVGNQSIQVPFLLRLHDPALFARDQMVNLTLDQYPSLFFRALAKTIPVVPVPWLYLWLHLLTACGVFLAIVALCSAMFKNRWSGLIAGAMLVAGHHQALAEQTLYSTGFTHTWAVFPLVIGALALLYADQPLAAFALTGLIFNIHALDAAYLVIAMGFWAVCSRPRVGLWKMSRWFIAFALFASPTLIFMATHRQHFDATWLQLMRVRSAQHSFPYTWWLAGQADIPQFLLVLALAGVSLSLLPPGQHLRKTLLLTTGVLGMFVIGTLFTEIWPSELVIRAQFFRSSRILMILALVCIAEGCRHGWSMPGRHGRLEFILATIVFACLTIPPWLILLPFALVAATAVAFINRRLLWQQSVVTGAALLVCLVAWRTIDFVVPGLSPGFSWKALTSLHPPAPGNDPAWVDVQQWARENTPANALFLTPAQLSGFRIHSQRAVVGEWRDGTQLFFSNTYAQPWWERMNALQPGMRLAPDGRHLLVQGHSLSQLGDEQILALANRFAADYIVLSVDIQRTLQPVYRNTKWIVYVPERATIAPVKIDTTGEQQHFMETVVLPNIEKNRMSNARLQVLDATGRPLYDAHYRIVQTRSAFSFGAASTNALFNATVLTEPAWWMNIEPQDGQPHYTGLEDALCSYHHKGAAIEFSFLAGFPPAWLATLSDSNQTKRLLQHATDLVDRYADTVDYWQITDHGLFLNDAAQLITQLRLQHPQLKLGLSDAPRLYSTRPVNPPHVLNDLLQLKAQGIQLDFVALQGHQPWGVWADPKSLYDLFDTLANEGVRIHISAFAAPSAGWIEGAVRHGQWTPELQAEYCRIFYTVCYSHPAVDMVNYLELGPVTRVPDIGLFEATGAPKPAFRALQELITKHWRTETNGTIALDGMIPLRGFQGTYDLAVTSTGGQTAHGTFDLSPGTSNNFRFQLAANGTLVKMP